MAQTTAPREAATPLDGFVNGRLAQLRQMQADLQARPVTGSMTRLKKPFYKLVRSAFTRQLSLNVATVDLLETIYREMGHGAPPAANRAQGAFDCTGASDLVESGQVVSSAGQVQDQAKLNGIRPLHGLTHVYTAPAELRMPERMAIYSLVFGMQPKNVLEIGTFRGGSTAIMCGAMDDTGFGRIFCVDPMPQVAPELWAQISHRCQMFEGPSPDILPAAAAAAGAPFDFAFIDGNHTYEYLSRDIAGTLPHLADSAHLLFHDAHYDGVRRAIDEAVARSPQLTDCGLASVEPTVLTDNGQTTTWAGLRLVRFCR